MIAGGTCSYDLPAYYQWLNMSSEMRQQAFFKWLKPLENIKKAIETSLKVIRESGHFKETTAKRGYFQEALKDNRQLQLIRVSIDRSENMYPEISAGKMRYSIRFFSRNSIEEKAAQVMADVNFKISTCTL
jgi:cell division protein ZapD